MKRCLLQVVALLLLTSAAAFGQTVTGRVTSSTDGSAVPGASVLIKGTGNGTSTDSDGKFTINAGDPNAILVVSFIGFATQEIAVESRTTIDVVLQEDVTALNEVIVTALGISREKKTLGYAAQDLKGNELTTIQTGNVTNGLAGKIAGVVVTPGSTGPGGSVRVVIRGSKSLGGANQPLYVVDGIPVDNSGPGGISAQTSQYNVSDFGSGISDINPDDIESMTVLKGPNAAALYGARATNGVIIITTKKGNAKGLGININSSATFETPFVLPKFQNKYGQGTNGVAPASVGDLVNQPGSWGAALDGSEKPYYTGETKAYTAQEDNVRDFFETGRTFSNSISLQGGTGPATFYLSYTNFDSKGILPNNRLTKNNFNLRGTAQLGSKLSIDAKITYFLQEAKNRPEQGESDLGNTTTMVFNMPRNVAISDAEKVYQNPNGSPISWTSSGYQPYWIANKSRNEDTKHRVLGFTKLTYKFNDWLSVFGRVGTDFTTQKTFTLRPYYHPIVAQGAFVKRTPEYTETNVDGLIMINKDLSEKISFTMNIGASMRYNKYENFGFDASGLRYPDAVTLESASTKIPFYDISEKKVNSWYGSMQLGYSDYLFLDVTGRNDWASTLPANNRSYFYPSASLSWVASDMFDVNSDVLSFLKARVSWSSVSNDTDPYRTGFVYTLDPRGYLTTAFLSVPRDVPNANLVPETSNSTEFGAEIRLFQNRVYVDASYYSIVTKDQIVALQTPESAGFSTFFKNVGQVSNKGVELMIGGTPIKNDDFTWDVSVNFAHNKNKLDKLVDGLKTYQLGIINNGGISILATAGGGFGDIYGFDYLRKDGQIVVNAQGVPMAETNAKIIGNYQPKATIGFTNSFLYKGFNVRMLIDGRIGGEIYSFTDRGLWANGVSEETLGGREDGILVDGVFESGTANNVTITAQQYYQGVAGAISTPFIKDATNFRVRELSVSYALPVANLKLPFKSASLGIVARNLFFLYKKTDNFDPEASYSTGNAQGVAYYNLPSTRSLGFNLNLGF
ncbi:SusC/RagA family TonB-linked outer membrane protein [Pseudochryseolinea flava]|nr:SusC/RagA family TonB-linked outer membrane protein [Pseudochryseolinea flava]